MLVSNPFAAVYKLMYDLEKEEIQVARQQNRTTTIFRMYLLSKPRNQQIHPGRLNLPQGGQIAAVFLDKDGRPPNNVDICVHLRHEPNRNMHRINYLSKHNDPLSYPLLFPYGDFGNYFYYT